MLPPARHALHVDGPAGRCGSEAHRAGARPLPRHAVRRRGAKGSAKGSAKGTVHTRRTGCPRLRATRPRFPGQGQRLSSPAGCPAVFCDTDSSLSDLDCGPAKQKGF